jgi:hypothetical protein
MPGFLTQVVGTPTNRGKARRYEGEGTCLHRTRLKTYASSNIAGWTQNRQSLRPEGLSYRGKGLKTSGLGPGVVAGRNLQSVIFAGFCAY